MNSPEIRLFRNAGFEMEYFSFGHGRRPFVILPGVSMKSVMLSAAGIAEGFQTFAGEWTVYVFDRKKQIREGYSVADMAEDTAAAMTALGLSGCDVFGASQGGMIAQCIAVSHPELVHALYLGSTMARPTDTCRKVIQSWLDLTRGGSISKLNHAVNCSIYSPEFYEAYRDVFAQLEAEGTQEEIARFCVLLQACLSFDIYDRLAEVRCPVFAVGSRADRVLGAEGSAEIAEKLHCPLYLYDGYSHAVYDEAPDYRDRMKAALLSLS